MGSGGLVPSGILSVMAICRQLLLPRDLRPAAGQTEDEDKDVTLHDCGVMKYTRSLGQSRIPDIANRRRLYPVRCSPCP